MTVSRLFWSTAVLGFGFYYPYYVLLRIINNSVAFYCIYTDYRLLSLPQPVTARMSDILNYYILPFAVSTVCTVLLVEALAHNKLMHALNGNMKRALEVPDKGAFEFFYDGLRFMSVRVFPNNMVLGFSGERFYRIPTIVPTTSLTMIIHEMRLEASKLLVLEADEFNPRNPIHMSQEEFIFIAWMLSPVYHAPKLDKLQGKIYRYVQDIETFDCSQSKFNVDDARSFYRTVRDHPFVQNISADIFALHMLRRSGLTLGAAFKCWVHDHAQYKVRVQAKRAVVVARSLFPYTQAQEELMDALDPASDLFETIEAGRPLSSRQVHNLLFFLKKSGVDAPSELIQLYQREMASSDIKKQSSSSSMSFDQIVRGEAKTQVQPTPANTDDESSDDEDYKDVKEPKGKEVPRVPDIVESIEKLKSLSESSSTFTTDKFKPLVELPNRPKTDTYAGRFAQYVRDLLTVTVAIPADVKEFVDDQTKKVFDAAASVSQQINETGKDIKDTAKATVEQVANAAQGATAQMSSVANVVATGLYGIDVDSKQFIIKHFGERWVFPLTSLLKVIRILAFSKVVSESSSSNQAILIALHAAQHGLVETTIVGGLSLLARQLFQPDVEIEKQAGKDHDATLYTAFMSLTKYVLFGTWTLQEKPKDVLSELNGFMTLIKHGVPIAEKVFNIFRFCVNKLGMWMFNFPIFDYVFSLQGDRLLEISRRAANLRSVKEAVGVAVDLDSLILEAREANASEDYLKKLIAVRIDVAHWMSTHYLSTEQCVLVHMQSIYAMKHEDARSAWTTINKQLAISELSSHTRTAWLQLGNELKSSIRTEQLRDRITSIDYDDIQSLIEMRKWLTEYSLKTDMPYSEQTVVNRTEKAIIARMRELTTLPLASEWAQIQDEYTYLANVKDATRDDYFRVVNLEARINSCKIAAVGENVDPDVKRGIQDLQRGYLELRRSIAARYAATGKTPAEQLLLIGSAGIGKTLLVDILVKMVAKKMRWDPQYAKAWVFTPGTNFPSKYNHEKVILVDDFNMIKADEYMMAVLDLLITQGSPVKTFPEDPLAEQKSGTIYDNAIVVYTGNIDDWPATADPNAIDRRLTLGRLYVTVNPEFMRNGKIDLEKAQLDFASAWSFKEGDKVYDIVTLADAIAATLAHRQEKSVDLRYHINQAVNNVSSNIVADPISRPKMENTNDTVAVVPMPRYITVHEQHIRKHKKNHLNKQMKFTEENFQAIADILNAKKIEHKPAQLLAPYLDEVNPLYPDYDLDTYLSDADLSLHKFLDQAIADMPTTLHTVFGPTMKDICSTLISMPIDEKIRVYEHDGCSILGGHKLCPCLIHGMSNCGGRKAVFKMLKVSTGATTVTGSSFVTVADLQRRRSTLVPDLVQSAYDLALLTANAMDKFMKNLVISSVVLMLSSPLIAYAATKLFMTFVGVTDVQTQSTYYAADVPRHVRANRSIPAARLAKQSEHGTFPESMDLKIQDNIESILNKVAINTDHMLIGIKGGTAKAARAYMLGLERNIAITPKHIFVDFAKTYGDANLIRTIGRRYAIYDLREIKAGGYVPEHNVVQWYGVPGHDLTFLFFPRTHPSYPTIMRILNNEPLELQMIQHALLVHTSFTEFNGPKGVEYNRSARTSYEMGPAYDYTETVVHDGSTLPAGIWFQQNSARHTREGDCGLPYVFNYKGRLCVLGIHEAGGGTVAIAAPLSTDLVEDVKSAVAWDGNDRPIALQADIIDTVGGVEAVPCSLGAVKKEFKVHVASTSKLVKSDIAGCLTGLQIPDWSGRMHTFPVCTAEPAKMGKFEGATGMHRAIVKKHRVPHYTSEEMMAYVKAGADMVYDRIGPIPYTIRPLTWQEVLDGKPDWGISPIDHQTSPGPPITSWQPHAKGKDEWFTVTLDGEREWVPHMLDRLKVADELLRRNVIPQFYDEDSLKDELRDVKVEIIDDKVHKTYKNVRGITNCDNTINFLCRRYCTPITGYFSKNRVHNGMLAGIDLNSPDGHLLAAKLGRGILHDWDVGNKDGTTRTQFALISHKHIDCRLAAPYYQAEDMIALEALGYTATQALCVADGVVYYSPDGLRSGNVFTTPLNMKDGQHMVMTCYLVKNGIEKSLDDFLRNVDVYNYNDDMVTCHFSDALTGEDVVRLSYEIFGYELTDGKKNKSAVPVKLHELTLLKRSPINSPVGPVWVLNTQTMVRTIDYVWKGVNIAKNHNEVAQALLMEVAVYGPRAFNIVRDTVNLALVRSSHPPCVLTFEQAWGSVKQRRGIFAQCETVSADQVWSQANQTTAVQPSRVVKGLNPPGPGVIEPRPVIKPIAEKTTTTVQKDNTQPDGVINNSTPSSTAKLTSFTDATLVTTVEVPQVLDLSHLGSGSAKKSSAVTGRNYQIYTVTFGGSVSSGTVLAPIILPDVLLTIPQVAAAFYGYRFLKTDVKIRLTVNSSAYVSGAVAVTFLPFYKHDGARPLPYFPHVDPLSLLSNATNILDLSSGETMEITLPWSAPFPFMDLMATAAQGGIGTLYLTVLHPIVSSMDSTPPDVTITVYASFENVSLDGPTLQGLALPMVRSDIRKQSGMEDFSKSAAGVMQLVGGAVKTVSDVAGIVSANPALLTMLAGLDKPTSVEAPKLVMNRLVQGWQHGNGLDAGSSLSVVPLAKAARKNRYGPRSTGTPTLTDIITKPGRVLTFSFDNSVDQTTLLACLPVRALQGIFIPASGGTDFGAFYPLPVSYLAPGFAAWRGGFNYLVYCSMPKGVVGKLRVSFTTDVNDITTVVPANRTGDLPSVVIDLMGTTKQKIHIPWISSRPFLEVMGNTVLPNVVTEGNTMGLLKFQLTTPLTSQAVDVSAKAFVSIYASGDESFEYINPMAISNAWTGSWQDWWGGVPADPPSARLDHSVIKKQAAIHEEFTGKFESLWPSKTYSDLGIYTSEKMPDVAMIAKRVVEVLKDFVDNSRFTQSIYYPDNVNDPTAGGTAYPCSLSGNISKLYRGWAGSLRYKFFLNTNSTDLRQPRLIKLRLLGTEYGLSGPLDNSLGDGLVAWLEPNENGIYEFHVPWLHQQAWRETQEVQYWEWNSTPFGGGGVRDWQLTLEFPTITTSPGYPNLVQFMAAGDDYSLGLYMGPPCLRYFNPATSKKTSSPVTVPTMRPEV